LEFNFFIRTLASESNNKSKEPCHCGMRGAGAVERPVKLTV
jgi:hypothetical protein